MGQRYPSQRRVAEESWAIEESPPDARASSSAAPPTRAGHRLVTCQ